MNNFAENIRLTLGFSGYVMMIFRDLFNEVLLWWTNNAKMCSEIGSVLEVLQLRVYMWNKIIALFTVSVIM